MTLMVDERGSKTGTTKIMNETPLILGSSGHEIIELFRKINVSRPIAFTLACLSKGREISFRSLEIVSGLRHPEASVAMRDLCGNN